MNALNRELKVGDKLWLIGGETAVVAAQTFGCLPFTAGAKIGVTIDGEDYTIDGMYHINPEYTLRHFAGENGWKS